MADHLIVFTRYPAPGETKTRLIPALGAAGAADLQQKMTEHTLKQVQACQRLRSLTVDIRFTGATQAAMQTWLGAQWIYRPQGGGDLGDRLLRAFAAAAIAGCRQIVAIGIDCPQLNAARLDQAFEQLSKCNIVLGPAADGGYYLIGLKQPLPELFEAIDWGTSTVLAQTVAAAEKAGLSVAYLNTLEDVDEPKDLAVWEAVCGDC